MSLHDELFATARYLALRNNRTPTEADLRRCISTAYYALFHRLIDATVAGLVPGPHQQGVIARMFEHGKMKALCAKVIEAADRMAKPTGGRRPQWVTPYAAVLGTVLPPELLRLAEAFGSLQEARHTADYNRAARIRVQDARSALGHVQRASADLAAVENTPPGRAFLLLLLLGEPKAR